MSVNISITPDWMSDEAVDTLNRGYLLPGETPRDLFLRVANTVEKYIPEPGLAKDIFDCLYKGYIGCASPVLSNFGTARGLPISCYALSIDDNLHSIYSHLKESAALSKYGGGVGAYFGNIRHAGSTISSGGKSGGIVPWARQYDLCASVVSQGATRRGSYALYIDIDHPDLEELLRCKDHSQGDPRSFIDSNIAVTVTNAWLEEMLAGDEQKKEIFSRVLELRMVSGSPYIIFIDNVNEANPDCYKQRNLNVTTSNLCLGGDTIVATPNGAFTIEALYSAYKQAEVEFPVYCRDMTTGEVRTRNAKALYNGKKPFITIELSDKTTFRCTPEHRLATKNGKWVEAQDSLGETLLGVGMSEKDYPFVLSVSPLSSFYIDVYDLTVEDDHNFYILTDTEKLTGILVHNCSEITLYTDENHTFVCVLSSLNLLRYPEWKDYKGAHTGKSVPELMIYLLDAVCEEFIVKASRLTSLGRAVRFAKKSRALGAGTMGLAALYQKLGLPFKSPEARQLNIEIHKYIKEESVKASKSLAASYGEPEWCEGSGMRNTHLLASAPTRTNSVICGAISQGIEPLESNYFIAKQAKGSFVRKNPFLEATLESYGKNTDEVWESLLDTQGSVQHLDFLTPREKEVYLTAREIDQFELLRQASDRQKYICQAQSLNLFVNSDTSAEDIWLIHLAAWRYKLKSLYYLRSSSTLINREKSVEAYDNIIVTKPGCPYCDKAKQYLLTRGYSFKEISKEKAMSSGLYRESLGTFPQIYISKTFIGGYDQLMEYFEENERSNECVACEG